MKDFSLRVADEQDIEFLVEVLIFSAPDVNEIDAQTIAQCKKRVLTDLNNETPESITYVIERAGHDIGRLRLVETDNILFIGGIQLLPDHQGCGLGSSILCALISRACKLNKSLRLEVQKSNIKAKKLYLRLGFTVEEVLEDDEVMVKSTPSMYLSGSTKDALS